MAETPNLPRRLDSSEALDDYEAKYMQATGPVVFRTKARNAWQAPAFAGATALFVVLWCATHANLGLGLGLGLGAGILLLGLFFAVLRVTVSSEYVDVQYGLIGPKIPLTSIESVEAVRHKHRGMMRWGVTPLGKGKWLYSIAGDKGQAVKIVWRTAKGELRTHLIGSPEHEELARSIEEARGRALEASGEGASSRALSSGTDD